MASSPPSPPSHELDDMAIHPNRPAQFTLQLSEELGDLDSHSSGYSSVRINHKPSLPSGVRTAKIRQSSGSNAVLSITGGDEDGAYKYEGKHQKTKKSFIIAFDPATGTATLKPVSDSYSFNLRSTPSESSEQLKTKYKQIHERKEDSDDANSMNDVGAPASAAPLEDNPFDFRHYLHRQPSTKPNRKSRSPSPNHLAAPKPTGRERSVSAPQTPSQPTRSLVTKQPTPTIRLDRTASVREDEIRRNRPPPKKAAPLNRSKQPKKKELSKEFISSDSDSDSLPLSSTRTKPTSSTKSKESIHLSPEPASRTLPDLSEDSEDDFGSTSNAFTSGGGLEIVYDDEDESSQPKRPRSRTLPTSAGPISLRSAANSPSSQVHTPRMQASSLKERMGTHYEDEEEIELGGGGQEEYEDDEEDAEGDVDVEPIDLGPPAHLAGGGEDYSDLEAALIGDDSEESEAE